MTWELTQHLIVQNDQAICQATHHLADRWAIQLYHRQLIKGIPSFYIHGIDDLIRFQNGFVYGNRAPADYEFYCNAMRSTYHDYIILPLFNVYPIDKDVKKLPGVDNRPRLR